MTDETQVSVSVVPDGATSWVCRVDWPDGHRYREVGGFFLDGLPVVITSEAQALECLAAWVKRDPEYWRPASR